MLMESKRCRVCKIHFYTWPDAPEWRRKGCCSEACMEDANHPLAWWFEATGLGIPRRRSKSALRAAPNQG